MGGCRCTFRGCESSTFNRPGLHFFHYPVKNKERCEKWISLANNPSFSTMEAAKLKNRNICEDHFKLEMFMNYKRERLIRTAYPSLLKIRTGKLLDVEKMLNDHVNIQHLTVNSDMPPGGECYIYEPTDTTDVASSTKPDDSVAVLSDYEITEDKHEEQTLEIIPIDFKQDTLIVDESSVSENEGFKRKHFDSSANITILTPVPKKKKVEPSPNIPQIKKLLNTAYPIKSTGPTAIKIQHLPTFVVPSAKVKELEAELKKKTENEIQLQNLTKSCQQKIKNLESQISSMKQKILNAEKQQVKAEVHSVCTQTDNMPNIANIHSVKKFDVSPTQTKSSNLTKPQLFNGIKRYLSNAMSVLLKMEMFGSSDREWKQDEKKISCEIMQLGENVYDYLIDEWRLRLPSKTEVTQWLQENTDEDDEDLY